MKILMCILSCLSSIVILAQQPATRVLGEYGQPLAKATVSLLKLKDSAIIRTVLTDTAGVFVLTRTGSTAGLLFISAAGYTSRYAPDTSTTVQLDKKLQQLKEISITAKKPLIEIKADRLVFNVENSINATGSNGLELLQKSPGVIVDKDDNIILSGKNGARIYIDGKPSPLAGTDLAAYLRGINSIDIEAIEIITNPSSRYDAEGNAGIINIKLKKNKNYGWNGTASAGYGIGVYAKYNAGTSLNYRNKKINFFSNYSAYNNRNENRLNLYRLQNDTSYDQRSIGFSHATGHNLKTGLDINLSKKATLGFMVNGSIGDNNYQGNSQTPIAAAGSKTSSILSANGTSRSYRTNISENINYKYSDTMGRVLSIDLDKGSFFLRNKTYTPNVYTDASSGQFLSGTSFHTNTPVNINLVSAKADYEQNLWKGRFAAGLKSSLVKTDNDFAFYNDDASGNPIYDNTRSNHFIYTEWINAVYGQYQRKINKIDVQLGLRLEHTSSKGDLRAQDSVANKLVKRNFIDFFPSAGINWAINAKNSMGISYSRRIDRPRYQDLNPFENKIDELSYQKGNPFLKPQYTNVIELRHTYQYKLSSSISYSDVHDFFAQVSDTIEGKRSYIMQRNLASQQILSLNISYPFNITKWWSIYANLTVYHTRYRASFEQNKTIRLDATVCSFYQSQNFQLGKKWTAELSGFYNSPSIWGGTYKARPIWTLDAGIQKKCLNDNASIKISVTDIFRTMPWAGVSQFGGLYIKASGSWESRQVKINFTYRFGNKKVKTASNRKTGLEDLNDRAS